MRAVLKVRGVADRRVWVADSFQGLPPPNPERCGARQYYGAYPSCRAATVDSRASRGITERIDYIDGAGVFWQRGVA